MAHTGVSLTSARGHSGREMKHAHASARLDFKWRVEIWENRLATALAVAEVHEESDHSIAPGRLAIGAAILHPVRDAVVMELEKLTRLIAADLERLKVRCRYGQQLG